MTHPQPRDQKQLEQATSQSPSGGAPLDDESAALREGWLALGGAVDRANRDFREEDLLKSLLAAGVSDARFIQKHEAPYNAGSAKSYWPALLAGALALTALVAVSIAWWRVSGDRTTAGAPDPPPAPLSGDDAWAADVGVWSDPLDDELAETAQHVQSWVARTTGVDDSLLSVAEQLNSISDDLTNSSL
jgi:hypothetical protein